MGALVGSLLLFLVCVGLVVAMRQRGGLEKDQGGHHYLSTRYCTVLYCTVLYCTVLTYLSTSTTETEVKEKDDTLWIDRRWNNVDSGGKTTIEFYICNFLCNYLNIFCVSEYFYSY